MKDPADREIEDVVSSIRRLVSQEVGAAVSRGPARRDRLVLGPALRVGGPAMAKEPPAAEPRAANKTPEAARAARERATPAAAARRQEPSPAAEEAALLEQRIAELEAAIASNDEDWEFGASGLSGASPSRGPGRRAAPASGAGAGGAAAPETADEDRMRALIGDIVREELQGALGERITRNIRKLVRREISRALAVRDSK